MHKMYRLLALLGFLLSGHPTLAQSSTTASTLSTVIVSNDGGTGTTLNKLAKLNSSSNAVVSAISDTDGAIGVVISNAGTTGKAQISYTGLVKCVFDGTATAGNTVQISSSVTGDCHDTGTTVRPGNQLIGRVVTGGVGAGTYTVLLSLDGPITTTTPGGGLVSSTTANCSQTAFTITGTLSVASCVNVQSGTTYAIADSDRGKIITASNAAAQAYSIAQASTAGAFFSGWSTFIENNSTNVAGVITITPALSQICAQGVCAATYKIQPGQFARITSDGTNYQVTENPQGNQVPGTTTNDSANPGNVGEVLQSTAGNTTSTVTISNASPAVITWTAHGLTQTINGCSVITFTTTGALPTGLTVGTAYYLTVTGVNTLQVSTSVANCVAGTFVNTSSAGSGTHTAVNSFPLTNATVAEFAGIQLTKGEWDVYGNVLFLPAASTSITQYLSNVTATSLTLDGTTPFAANFFSVAAQVPGSNATTLLVGPIRVQLAGNANYFLDGRALFTVSTMQGYGSIRARRVR